MAYPADPVETRGKGVTLKKQVRATLATGDYMEMLGSLAGVNQSLLYGIWPVTVDNIYVNPAHIVLLQEVDPE